MKLISYLKMPESQPQETAKGTTYFLETAGQFASEVEKVIKKLRLTVHPLAGYQRTPVNLDNYISKDFKENTGFSGEMIAAVI